MKKQILKTLALIVKGTIRLANNTTCVGWTYQPKAPEGIKNFNKH